MKYTLIHTINSIDTKGHMAIFAIASKGIHSFVNIGSGNGLVPSGNKPLPEPLMSNIYDTIRHHNAAVS